MRWPAFFILAYVILALQLGLASFISWHGAQPNLILIAAVFIAMNAPRDSGLLGCFLLGFCQDLTSIGPLGLHAFTLGLIGLGMMSVQQVIYREHPLTHVAMTLAAGLIGLVVLTIWARLYPWLHGARHDGQGQSILIGLLGVVYTAAVAPLVIHVLQRIKGLFGFRITRANVMGRS